MYIHVMMSSITFSLYIAIASRRPNLGYAKSSNILFKQGSRERERGVQTSRDQGLLFGSREGLQGFLLLYFQGEMCACVLLFGSHFFKRVFPRR